MRLPSYALPLQSDPIVFHFRNTGRSRIDYKSRIGSAILPYWNWWHSTCTPRSFAGALSLKDDLTIFRKGTVMNEFRTLPVDLRFQIAARSTPWTFEPGELLIQQGKKSNALLIIVEGKISVSAICNGGINCPIAKIGRGAILGEMSLLLGLDHTACVKASTKSTAFLLSLADFFEIRTSFPQLDNALEEILLRRLELTRHNFHVWSRYADLVEKSLWGNVRSAFAWQNTVLLRDALRPKDNQP